MRESSGKARGFVSEVNLAKFYYKTAEKKGIRTADVWYLQVRGSRIKVVAPDERITRTAALWKVKRSDLSLADCFAIATREAAAQLLVTTDSTMKAASGREVVHLAMPKNSAGEAQ